jgi:hypothetical protein
VGMVRRVGKGVNKVCRSAMGLREGGNVHTAAAADNGTRVGCESGAQQGQGGVQEARLLLRMLLLKKSRGRRRRSWVAAK